MASSMNPSVMSPSTTSPLPFIQSMTKPTADEVAVELETETNSIKQTQSQSFSDMLNKSIHTNEEHSFMSNHSYFNNQLCPYSSKSNKQRSTSAANSSRITPISLSPYVYSLSMNSNSDIPYYDEDEILDTNDINNDMKKLLFQPKWAKKDELLEYEQLPTNKYYEAHKEILDNMKYSQNMVMEKLKRKQRGNFKNMSKPQLQTHMVQRHPFEMFLDEMHGIHNNNYNQSETLSKPQLQLSEVNSMSTLGPSASVLMNDDSGYNDLCDVDNGYVEWSVVKPTQQVLHQLNLQTNNNLLLKEVQRLRGIVSQQKDMCVMMEEKDFQIKTLRSTNMMLMEKIKLLQIENSRLNESVDVSRKKYKKNKKLRKKFKEKKRSFASTCTEAKKEHMEKLRNRTVTSRSSVNNNCSNIKHVHF